MHGDVFGREYVEENVKNILTNDSGYDIICISNETKGDTPI